MFLFAGLGNPGQEYQQTRHNTGFMAVDEIIRRFSFSSGQSKFHAMCHTGMLGSHKVLAIKPQTYMNRSGVAVAEAACFYKIPPERVFVFYDELDLVTGKVRVKKGGGSGGHNGIKDIDARIGSDYFRIRIGIDHPGDKHRVSGYVLSPFSTQEWAVMEPALWALGQYAPLLTEGDIPLFMSRVAEKNNP